MRVLLLPMLKDTRVLVPSQEQAPRGSYTGQHSTCVWARSPRQHVGVTITTGPVTATHRMPSGMRLLAPKGVHASAAASTEHTVEIVHRVAGGPWPVCMALALPNPHISLRIRLVEHMAPFRGVCGHEWARTGRLDRTLSQHTARASTPRGGI